MNRGRLRAGLQGGFLLLFGFLWCAIVAFLDYELGGMVARQALTSGYEAGRASILESSLEESRSSKGGRTYGVKVLYTYQAGGREHTSDRHSFNAMKSSDRKWASAAVQRWAKGAEVPVYFDPMQPETSVLRRGLGGQDLFVLMFVTPFNAIAAGLLAAAVAGLRGALRDVPVLVSRAGRNLREHIDAGGFGLFATFLAALGLGSFAGIFVVALSGGFHPSLRTVGIAWIMVLALALWAVFRTWQARRRGDHEIVIDRQNGILSLPPMQGRKQPIEVALSEIESVEAAVLAAPTGRRRRQQFWEVQLRSRDGSRQILFKPGNIAQAERIAEALRQKLGLPPRGSTP